MSARSTCTAGFALSVHVEFGALDQGSKPPRQRGEIGDKKSRGRAVRLDLRPDLALDLARQRWMVDLEPLDQLVLRRFCAVAFPFNLILAKPIGR